MYWYLFLLHILLSFEDQSQEVQIGQNFVWNLWDTTCVKLVIQKNKMKKSKLQITESNKILSETRGTQLALILYDGLDSTELYYE